MQEFVTIPTYLVEELKDKPYSKLGAYIDILNMAEESGGEFETTRRTLEKRWGWSGYKVNSFLSILEEKTIIRPKKNQRKTTITLVNSIVLENVETKERPKKDQKKTKEKAEDTEICKRVIEHLNMVCGTRYRYESEDSTKFIRERLNEGFSEEDFYDVIDKKSNEWLGTQWEQYLRPYTLFRKDKFENYLNQKVQKRQETKNINASRQSQLEYLLNSIREDEKNDRDGC